MTTPGAVFDEACVRCGSEVELVEDERVPGLHLCRRCLDRVAAQNEMIARGLEDEPEVHG